MDSRSEARKKSRASKRSHVPSSPSCFGLAAICAFETIEATCRVDIDRSLPIAKARQKGSRSSGGVAHPSGQSATWTTAWRLAVDGRRMFRHVGDALH